jgi:hypothetical protein
LVAGSGRTVTTLAAVLLWIVRAWTDMQLAFLVGAPFEAPRFDLGVRAGKIIVPAPLFFTGEITARKSTARARPDVALVAITLRTTVICIRGPNRAGWPGAFLTIARSSWFARLATDGRATAGVVLLRRFHIRAV